VMPAGTYFGLTISRIGKSSVRLYNSKKIRMDLDLWVEGLFFMDAIDFLGTWSSKAAVLALLGKRILGWMYLDESGCRSIMA